jgi:hypothetical protein
MLSGHPRKEGRIVGSVSFRVIAVALVLAGCAPRLSDAARAAGEKPVVFTVYSDYV